MADETEETQLVDIRKKLALIRTVIKKCDLFVNAVEMTDAHMNPSATGFFTNLSSSTIVKATMSPKAVDLKLLMNHQQALKDKVKESNILSSKIHDLLYEYYVVRRKVVHLKTLERELGEDFRILLKYRGFIWKQLYNDKRCILIEDPEVQAERIRYLLDMKRFREEKRTLVYVEAKAMPPNDETLSKFKNGHHYLESAFRYVKVAVSPQLGVLSLSKDNQQETVSDWLLKEVAQHLKPSYVLVTDEVMLNEIPMDIPPLPEAKKADMIYWLERNNIPHNTEMHRSELYELIELYKDNMNNKRYFTVEILKCKGVEVVFRPRKFWPDLNYFETLWSLEALWQDIVHGSFCTVIESRIVMALNVTRLSTWENHDKLLEKKEMELFEKDMELEETIEALLVYTKDTVLPESDLPRISEIKKNDVDRIVAKVSQKLGHVAQTTI